jgi:hypothetical protein
MAPCHIPGYRSPEYQHAFDELWTLACHGQVTVEQVRQEMLRLRSRFGIGASSWPCDAGALRAPANGAASPWAAQAPTRRNAL